MVHRFTLSQDFEGLDDFNALFTVGWDSDDKNSAMQNVSLALRDTTGETVIWASYHDAWLANRGRVTVIVDGTVYDGPNNLAHSGTGTFEIQRNAGMVTVLWNGGEVLTGFFDNPVASLDLRFQVGAWPAATFGELSVDLISCEGTIHVPVKTTTWGRIKAMQ
jgi:hypothetical protein